MKRKLKQFRIKKKKKIKKMKRQTVFMLIRTRFKTFNGCRAPKKMKIKKSKRKRAKRIRALVKG